MLEPPLYTTCMYCNTVTSNTFGHPDARRCWMVQQGGQTCATFQRNIVALNMLHRLAIAHPVAKIHVTNFCMVRLTGSRVSISVMNRLFSMLHREINMRTKWTSHASQHWVFRCNTLFMKNNWLRSQIPPLSTLTVCSFVLIRITSLGACKFENAALFLRIGVPSTLIRL